MLSCRVPRPRLTSIMSLVKSGTVVMIIDDDSDVRDSVADVLTMEGYEARPLRSADSAWTEMVGGTTPAAVILDQWIAGMSSGEFVRRLRASAFADVPVLMLSGSPPARKFGQDLDAVLQKPVESTTLVRAVDKLIGPKRSARIFVDPADVPLRQVA
jgi:DNA-binding response OmpR family regulator